MTVQFEIVNVGNTEGDSLVITDVKTGKQMPLGRGGVLRLGSGEVTLKIVPFHGNGDWRGEIESFYRDRQDRKNEQDLRL